MHRNICQSSICKHWRCLSLVVIILAMPLKTLASQVNNITNPDNQPLVNPIPRQNQPPSTQPLPEPAPPFRLPPPEELLPPTKSPEPEVTPQGEAPQNIFVEKFEVTGSTVFSSLDFAKITKPYSHRSISLAELFQLRSEITKLYVDKGYITSGAYIPPQKLESGVVEIRVVEGELEDIKVRGLHRLNPGYVRSRLKIATHKPLNRDRLLEALQLLQLNPLIQNLKAELSAGDRPGSSLLEVEVIEAKTLRTQIVLDNGRSPAVGSFRRQLQVSEANFFGFGDGISALYTNTDGSNALDLNYTVPINPRNGTVSFSYGNSDNSVIQKPFNFLDIQSNSRYYELTLRQPIIQKPTQEFALGITGTRRESEASYLGGEFGKRVGFPALGADENGRTRVTALRFFQDWTQRTSQEVFALRSQFSVGIGALNATINQAGPDSRFFSWRGQAQWVRLLAQDTVLLIRGDLQVSDRPLVPFEQFSLGGLESVRGYRQDALLINNGLFASAEVRIPIARFARTNSFLQVAPFVDFGTTWDSVPKTTTTAANNEPSTLVSIGFGLRLQLQDRLTARFDWGIPLISFPGDKNTWQENGLYFSIIANPF